MSFATFVLGVAGILGAMIGSFLNVCIYRLPRRCLRIWRPKTSFCPRCRRDIPWYENVPILGWLALRGRCRGCALAISPRYPLVELATALAFLYVTHRHVVLPKEPQWGAAITLATLAAALIVCTLVDADWRVIPWQVDIPGFLLAPVAAFLAPEPFLERGRLSIWLASPELPFAVGTLEPNLRAAVAAILGAVLGAVVIALIRWAGTRAFTTDRGAMGFDDVRFMAMLGGFSGWQGVLWTLAASSIVAAVFGLAKKLVLGRDTVTGKDLAAATFLGYYALRLAGAPASAPPEQTIALGRAGRLAARLATSDSYMPYGPCLAVAAAVYIYVPEAVVALGDAVLIR